VSQDGHVEHVKPSKPFSLYRAAMDNTQPEIVADDLETPFFSITKKFVYYIGFDQTLYAVPLRKRAARAIGRMRDLRGLRRGVVRLSVSPDDQTAVWAINEQQQLDLYMMRDFR
jgi:hypothetical protein